ncbi:uncharacterized protein F4807DRAFT_433589 [Annulohypoxylon truncatum]|uniref:uncharacterized protein n=1 Tax=Annulohypoxylon truncatum TaxID=327061 RepID=UPI0020079972|nr:uncharacterized protein F4807DRAFT_433589 [Annulohypoxylon truncatum]KAI1207878.1 hypothetical protein F4807DRAFT_433589 [Annulohypoxylon truncatum]
MTSFYDLTIPVLTKILQTEVELLKEAEKYAKENGKSVDDLLKARLSPDMFPASTQVSITAMFTNKILQILVGNKFEWNVRELTLEECYALIQGALADLAAVKPEDLNGREAEIVEFPIGKKLCKATAAEFVQRPVASQMYFHLNMLYANLRKEGVPLGKPLYLTHFIDGWTLH